jgi:hypothetical protein
MTKLSHFVLQFGYHFLIYYLEVLTNYSMLANTKYSLASGGQLGGGGVFNRQFLLGLLPMLKKSLHLYFGIESEAFIH